MPMKKKYTTDDEPQVIFYYADEYTEDEIDALQKAGFITYILIRPEDAPAKSWNGAYTGPTGPEIEVTGRMGKEKICQHDYNVLKKAGDLWKIYPDAPDVFPSQNEEDGRGL